MLINVACVVLTWQAGTLVTMLIAQAACLLSAGLLLKPDELSGHRTVAAAVGFPCLLLGFALIITLTGTTDLADIETALAASYQPDRADQLAGSGSILGIIAAVLIIAGCGIQAGLFPFHLISGDLFERSPAWLAAFLALTQRAQALLIMGRVGTAMAGFEETWQLVLLVLGVASALACAVLVSRCESLRSLSGHAWLLHGGVLAVGLAIMIAEPDSANSATSDDSVAAAGETAWQMLTAQETVLLLFVVGGSALCGVLACEEFLQLPDRRVDFLDDLAGLGRQSPLAAATLVIPLLTFVSVPPLPGFWALIFLTSNAFRPGHESSVSPVLVPSMLVLLALFAVIVGMLLLASRIVYVMSLVYFHEPIRRLTASGGMLPLTTAAVASILLAATGLLPGRLLQLLHSL
jgi:NADH-quinone oxidoreductase subunit N